VSEQIASSSVLSRYVVDGQNVLIRTSAEELIALHAIGILEKRSVEEIINMIIRNKPPEVTLDSAVSVFLRSYVKNQAS